MHKRSSIKLRKLYYTKARNKKFNKSTDGGWPSTPTQASQGERLDQDQDQGERLGRKGERLGREGERLGREGGRLPLELDRLGPLTRSMAKHIQTQANEATDGREKALYMFA